MHGGDRLAGNPVARFGIHKLADVSPYKSLAFMAPMLVLFLVAAHLSYFCFEIPSRRYLRDIFGGKPSPKSKGLGLA